MYGRDFMEELIMTQLDQLFNGYTENEQQQQPKQEDPQLKFSDDIKMKIYKKRGRYSTHSPDIKSLAISEVKKGNLLCNVSKNMNIPRKSLQRWINTGGIFKKRSGRRKLEQTLEKPLFQWCMNQCVITRKIVPRQMIKQQALQLTSLPNKFKASKGWVDKFMSNFQVKQNMLKELDKLGVNKKKYKYNNKKLVNVNHEITNKIQQDVLSDPLNYNYMEFSEGNYFDFQQYQEMESLDQRKKEIKYEEDVFHYE